MKKTSVSSKGPGDQGADEHDEQPLMRVLVAEALRRGDTLAQLAKHLGVTYQRLGQWRRGEYAIGNVRPAMYELAGQYLGIPTVMVMVMARKIGLMQFVWPDAAPLKDRVGFELKRLQQDPYLGAFVPAELAAASPAVQLLVVFLFRELGGQGAQGEHGYRWLRVLHQAAIGDQHGQLELDTLRKKAPGRSGIF